MTIYSATQKEAILADYYAGMPMKGITAKHGCEACLPARLAKRHGGNVRGKVQPHLPRGNWTRERDDKLKTLWNCGYTGRQIGVQLGISKNAVIGRAHRLGLPARALGSRKSTGERRARAKTLKRQEPRQTRPPVIRALAIVELPVLQRASRRLTLLELTPLDCKWPVAGTGEHTEFCGHVRVTGRPYCAFHVGRAYRAAEPPRQRGAAA